MKSLAIEQDSEGIVHIDMDNPDCFINPSQAFELREDLKELARTFNELASYCEGKGNAMQCRLKGDIGMAMKFENAIETVYRRLPKWAKF